METIQKAVLIAHTLIAIGIIVLVLLQRGKGADAGAAFGAGASGTVFGSRGSGSFFSRMTAILATAFFASSLTLAYLSSQRVSTDESLIDPAAMVEEADEAAAEPAIDDNVPALDDAPAGDGEVPALDDAVEEAGDVPALEQAPAEEDGASRE